MRKNRIKKLIELMLTERKRTTVQSNIYNVYFEKFYIKLKNRSLKTKSLKLNDILLKSRKCCFKR